MRIGILGVGRIADVHAQALRVIGNPAAAAYSPDSARRAGFCRVHDLTSVPSQDALIAASDLVLICTPTPVHADQAVAALSAGRHVIVEKPIARDEYGIERMLHAMRRSVGTLAVAHSSRYLPSVTAALQVVRQGRIGAVSRMQFERESRGPDRSRSTWLLEMETSGGVLLDSMIHDIDLALAIAGPAVSVSATASALAAEVEVVHANGAVSTFMGSWQATATEPRLGALVFGDRGVVEFEALAGGRARLDGHDLGVAAISQVEQFAVELSDLLGAALGEHSPTVSVAEAVEAARLCLRALGAAKSG